MRPIEVAEDGKVRFKANAIVRWLVDNDKVSLNEIAARHAQGAPAFPQEDVDEFWQMLGYSVSGYGELSHVSEESVEAADAIAEPIWAEQRAAQAVDAQP